MAVAEMIHVRVGGQSRELAVRDLDMPAWATDDATIRAAVARHLDVAESAVQSLVRTDYNGITVLRPEAVYG